MLQLQSATLQVLAAGGQGATVASSGMEPSHEVQPTASPVNVVPSRLVRDLQSMVHYENFTRYAVHNARKTDSEVHPAQRIVAAVVSLGDENMDSSCRDLQPVSELGESVSPPLQGHRNDFCGGSARTEASAENDDCPQCMLVADGEVVSDASFWEWAREDCGELVAAADTTSASFWEWART